jgi:PRTRC genetic system protein E
MAWKTMDVQQQRVRFVVEAVQKRQTFRALCEAYEISRLTGYLRLKRYREFGVEGIAERGRKPHRRRFMFTELMQLVENRPLTITVAALSEGRIRVNVVPQALAKDTKVNETIGYANKDKIAQVPEPAIHALTTPLSLTGKPEEIDAQLAEQLKTFVDSHLALQRSVDEAKQQIAEAVKAIEERDKTRSKSKTVPPKTDDKPSDNKVEEAKIRQTIYRCSIQKPPALSPALCFPLELQASSRLATASMLPAGSRCARCCRSVRQAAARLHVSFNIG